MSDDTPAPVERRVRQVLTARGLFRPLITFLMTTGLFFGSGWLVLQQMLEATLWFQSWIQIVGMLLAFFFGERSGLKGSDHDPEFEARKP